MIQPWSASTDQTSSDRTSKCKTKLFKTVVQMFFIFLPGFVTHSWRAFWSLRTWRGFEAMPTNAMISRNSSSPASHSWWTSSPPGIFYEKYLFSPSIILNFMLFEINFIRILEKRYYLYLTFWKNKKIFTLSFYLHWCNKLTGNFFKKSYVSAMEKNY